MARSTRRANREAAARWFGYTLKAAVVGAVWGALTLAFFAERNRGEGAAAGAFMGALVLGALPAAVCAWYVVLGMVAQVSAAARARDDDEEDQDGQRDEDEDGKRVEDDERVEDEGDEEPRRRRARVRAESPRGRPR